MADTEQQLDVRKLPPPEKHPTIFETFDNLNASEAFIIINDHDPKPLRYQFAAERGKGAFSWEYLDKGPEIWKVRIRKRD